MVSATPPPPVGACLVCGDDLHACAEVWVLEYPQRAHERCIDWTTRPFPYTDRLERLRRLWAQSSKSQRIVIAPVGRWLHAAEVLWPTGATEILEETRRQLSHAHHSLLQLGVSPRQLRGLR